MKLAAIYSVFDSEELLASSIKSISSDVDMVIIVDQIVSNYGEDYNWLDSIDIVDVINAADRIPYMERFNHDVGKSPMQNEKDKRNIGLDVARLMSCTHFIMLDCDEIYADFRNAKQQYIVSGSEGSVCPIMTYFKKPTLRLKTFDNYYVPFIHKLNPDTKVGTNNKYPFYVDPTRNVNTNDVALLSEPMHHFSWVRKDIGRKIRNSTAKNGIERTNILEIYNDPKTGAGTYIDPLYRQELIEVEDQFNLSAIFE